MRIDTVNSLITQYNRELTSTAIKIKEIEINNKNLIQLQTKRDAIEECIKQVNEQTNINKRLKKLINTESNNFRQRRIDFLEAYIEKVLSLVFPLRGYRVEISLDYKYGKQKASVVITDNEGYQINPAICEGGFFKQLIGYGASSSLTQSVSNGKMFLDEAFSAGSPENLIKVTELLKSLISELGQVFIVEQEHTVYKDLPRREIEIVYDDVSKKTVIESVKDY